MKFNKLFRPLSALFCLLCLCAFLSACRFRHAEVTTSPLTDPVPESTQEITQEITTTEETTEEITVDTTSEEETSDLSSDTEEETTAEITTAEETTEITVPEIYTVKASTEYGALIGGGKKFTFEGKLDEAEAFVASYNDFNAESYSDASHIHRFKEVEVIKNGKEWTLTLIWESEARRFTVTFDFGSDRELLTESVEYGDSISLPILEGREDIIRYYDFLGWMDQDDLLYEGGHELKVEGDVLLTAEFADGEMKVYEILFKTDIGFFANGMNEVVLSGHYGDVLIPPLSPDPDDLTFGEVVYEFAGWSEQPSPTIEGNAEYSAVYTTPVPAYRIDYYLNGELYLSRHYYVGTALTVPERPPNSEGYIFTGWLGQPETMPAENVRIDAVCRPAEVIYIINGDVILRTESPIGTVVTVAAPAQKQGYTVSGWNTLDISVLNDGSFIMPERDVTFYATAIPNEHKVTYIIDGETVYTDTVLYGEIYTLRGIEVMTGYEFIPWMSLDTSISIGNGIFTMPDCDITFAGSFKKCSYPVNYYLDGELIYSDVFEYGEEVVVRPLQEQAGCTFAWKTASVQIKDGAFIMPAGGVDIHGHFSAGDNKVIFMIDGEEYGSVGVAAGEAVDISFIPTRIGHTFTGWSCNEMDVSSGAFLMPEGDVILRGSFIPNVYKISFVDLESGAIIAENELDYGAEFSLAGNTYCEAGRVSNGLILIQGNAISNGDVYTMPDQNVVFGITWETCLTVELEEEYHIPYYALIGNDIEGCRYDERTNTLYVSDPAIKIAGESEGVTVIFEY